MTIKFENGIEKHKTQYTNEGKWSNLAASALLATNLSLPHSADARQTTPTSTNIPTAVSKQVKPNINTYKMLINMIVASTSNTSSVVTVPFVNKIMTMENQSFNPKAKGDFLASYPRARGLMQIHYGAWKNVARKHPIFKKFNYFKNAYNPMINLNAGITYLCDLEKELISYGVKKPTEEQVYAAWNAGMRNLKAHKFDPDQLAKYNLVFKTHLSKFRSFNV